MMRRRDVLALGAAGAATMILNKLAPDTLAQDRTAVPALATAPKRPNLLLIFSDQQHWRAAGFEDSFFSTPNLDRVAREGTVFANTFCTTPQCSPSRSSMLTGLYPHKTGVWGNVGNSGGEPLKMPTIGAMLRKAGYTTGYFGKWHLGADEVGIAGWDATDITGQSGEEGLSDPRTTREGIEYLKARAKQPQKPFALVLSYNNPHNIYRYKPETAGNDALQHILPESWRKETFEDKPSPQKQFMTDDQGKLLWDKNEAQWEGYRRWYRDKVAEYDAEVGKVLGLLDELKLTDNTVVFLTSDHGDMDACHKLIFKGPFMYEQMVHVPLIVRVPKSFGGGTPQRVAELVTLADLTPTMLSYAGATGSLPECDGRSLQPWLEPPGYRKGSLPPARDYIISEYYSKQRWVNPIRMIRTQRYKYNLYARYGEELYDLTDDPHELKNLAGDPAHAGAQRELRAILDGWMMAQQDPFPTLRPTDRQGQASSGDDANR